MLSLLFLYFILGVGYIITLCKEEQTLVITVDIISLSYKSSANWKTLTSCLLNAKNVLDNPWYRMKDKRSFSITKAIIPIVKFQMNKFWANYNYITIEKRKNQTQLKPSLTIRYMSLIYKKTKLEFGKSLAIEIHVRMVQGWPTRNLHLLTYRFSSTKWTKIIVVW